MRNDQGQTICRRCTKVLTTDNARTHARSLSGDLWFVGVCRDCEREQRKERKNRPVMTLGQRVTSFLAEGHSVEVRGGSTRPDEFVPPNLFVDDEWRMSLNAIDLAEVLEALPCDFADMEILGNEATADYCYAHSSFDCFAKRKIEVLT